MLCREVSDRDELAFVFATAPFKDFVRHCVNDDVLKPRAHTSRVVGHEFHIISVEEIAKTVMVDLKFGFISFVVASQEMNEGSSLSPVVCDLVFCYDEHVRYKQMLFGRSAFSRLHMRWVDGVCCDLTCWLVSGKSNAHVGSWACEHARDRILDAYKYFNLKIQDPNCSVPLSIEISCHEICLQQLLAVTKNKCVTNTISIPGLWERMST